MLLSSSFLRRSEKDASYALRGFPLEAKYPISALPKHAERPDEAELPSQIKNHF